MKVKQVEEEEAVNLKLYTLIYTTPAAMKTGDITMNSSRGIFRSEDKMHCVIIMVQKWQCDIIQVIEYFGPPPPSGTLHSIEASGTLMLQVLQWIQF